MIRLPLSHRLPPGRRGSPVGVVLAASCVALLWRGGFDRTPQIMLAAVGIACLLVWSSRPFTPRALAGGLTLTAVAVIASFAVRGGHAGAAAAAIAAPAMLASLAAHTSGLRKLLLPAIALTAATSAVAGLAALATHREPFAERIAGLWRAGGTLEYPPALGLLCVCGLAAVIGLAAAAELDILSALAAGALLVCGIAATFDRASAAAALVLLALAAWRLPATRRLTLPLLALSLAAGTLAVALAAPGGHALRRHLEHGTVSTRTDVWADAWDDIRERPWLGHGPGAFPALQAREHPRHPAYAHDAALQAGVNGGLAALAGTAVALLAMLVAGVRGLATRDPMRFGAGAIAAAVALSGLYDFTWSYLPLVVLGAAAALMPGQGGESGRAGPQAAGARRSNRASPRPRAPDAA